MDAAVADHQIRRGLAARPAYGGVPAAALKRMPRLQDRLVADREGPAAIGLNDRNPRQGYYLGSLGTGWRAAPEDGGAADLVLKSTDVATHV